VRLLVKIGILGGFGGEKWRFGTILCRKMAFLADFWLKNGVFGLKNGVFGRFWVKGGVFGRF
jgi:hypothetical protein